ncbi:MAG: competence/damage-inducible protein A [Deltaproteobacteria bacterium]|nr:MAG: competence/damage-inducible protein A [Deltaproteobacteria bacterium]
MTTAAVIIIGDEILTGKFADENGIFAIRRLRELGVDLERMVFIRDHVPTIAREVRECAAAYDWVFTSGGVGPTHDDMTLEAVAEGLGVGLEERPELVALLDRFGIERTEAAMRMTRVPVGTELVGDRPDELPVLVAGNVVVLPGIPRLFHTKFEHLAPRLSGLTMATARLYTDEHETDIAERLSAVDAAFADVRIGSYPRFGEGAHRVMVTLESRDVDALRTAAQRLGGELSLTAPIDYGGRAL